MDGLIVYPPLGYFKTAKMRMSNIMTCYYVLRTFHVLKRYTLPHILANITFGKDEIIKSS